MPVKRSTGSSKKEVKRASLSVNYRHVLPSLKEVTLPVLLLPFTFSINLKSFSYLHLVFRWTQIICLASFSLWFLVFLSGNIRGLGDQGRRSLVRINNYGGMFSCTDGGCKMMRSTVQRIKSLSTLFSLIDQNKSQSFSDHSFVLPFCVSTDIRLMQTRSRDSIFAGGFLFARLRLHGSKRRRKDFRNDLILQA